MSSTTYVDDTRGSEIRGELELVKFLEQRANALIHEKQVTKILNRFNFQSLKIHLILIKIPSVHICITVK